MPHRRYSRKTIFFTAITLFVFLKIAGYGLLNNGRRNAKLANTYEVRYSTGRHLLSGVAWEQCDMEIGHSRNYSVPSSWHSPTSALNWVLLYVVLIIIIFVALAVVCDDFFVPSLEAISEKLNLSEDVAGATFMAAGSSAPELFTSIAGVTAESDVGVGTIVGSAVFNLLGICALSAAFSGGALHLDWRPLTRDSIFYGTSICLFIIFAQDGRFKIHESIIMLSLYVLYIVLMKFNPSLMRLMNRFGKKSKIRPSLVPEKTQTPDCDDFHQGTSEAILIDDKENEDENTRKFSHKRGSTGRLIKELAEGGSAAGDSIGENKACEDGYEAEEDEYEEDIRIVTICPWCPPVSFDLPAKNRNGLLGIPRLLLAWTLFLMAFPFIILFTWTIPDCSTARTRKWYLFSFFMSIAWIALLSFATVTLVGRAGCILEIDKFTMGLVVVAIGTSIPDAMSSILVARDGYGDMAVSNAIGSNVFDIDLGIGLPFLISTIIKSEDVMLLPQEQLDEYLQGGFIFPHIKFGIILLVLLSMSIFIFIACKFILSRKLGLSFIILYVVFVTYAYVQDIHCNSRDC